MALIPAVCSTCGTVFASSSAISATNAKVTITGSSLGPCPQCGGTGRIPDGVYEFADDTIRSVWAARPTLAELKALRAVLSEAQAEDLPAEETARRVEDLDPKFKGFSSLLEGKSYAAIMLIVAILTLLVAMRDPRPHVTINVEQPPSLEEILKQLPQSGLHKDQLVAKPGRNDPCYCGSGKKYKRCHGAPQRKAAP